MKSSKKYLLTSILAIGAVSVFGISSVMAAETLGTVTGKDGDVKNKVAITAEIISVDGSHISFKDVDNGKEYESSVGPSWYTKEYTLGERVDIVGVETEATNNENNHNFQILEINGEALRDSFEGQPLWAGKRQGNGTGKGSGVAGTNRGKGSSFVDANNDGVCDNIN